MATYAELIAGRLVTRPAAAAGITRSLARVAHWPLIGVLALQAAVSLITLHNSAFQDEALYLYAGRQIIHYWAGGPPPIENYAFYFSGYPNAYPVIGGFLDMLGGLELARAFSLVCMLGVTSLGYHITDRLFGRRAAVFAAAAYALTGSVLFVGRLATFDAMCLLLIAVSSTAAVRGSMSKRPWIVLAIGPALVAAILAKYAALLFVLPAFALLLCLGVPFLGWRRTAGRVLLTSAGFAISLAVAYKTMNHSAFHAINGSTTNRDVILKLARLTLLLHVLEMGGAILALAFVGLLLTLRLQRRSWLCAVVLFGSAWLAPAYHMYVQESISLDKHIAYALFFAMPLAGYALAWISGEQRSGEFGAYQAQWMAGLALVMAIFTLGLYQSNSLYTEWANTTQLSTALHTQLRDGSGRILAEDIEVARFDAIDVTEPWQWNGVRFTYYVDAHHHAYLGDPALVHAISDRYYDWVELSFVYIPDEANFAAEQMVLTRNYDLVATILFQNSFGKGHFYLFRLALTPGHGNFTSLKQLKTTDWGA
jgi:4-amino-4-deoxy-L-arabinose transferase-like glycosyltransferase